MNFECISIFVLLVLSTVFTSATKGKTHGSNTDDNCICFNSTEALNILSHVLETCKDIQKRVIVLYQNVNTNKTIIYVPTLEKQKLIPTLPIEIGADLQLVADEGIKRMFKKTDDGPVINPELGKPSQVEPFVYIPQKDSETNEPDFENDKDNEFKFHVISNKNDPTIFRTSPTLAQEHRNEDFHVIKNWIIDRLERYAKDKSILEQDNLYLNDLINTGRTLKQNNKHDNKNGFETSHNINEILVKKSQLNFQGNGNKHNSIPNLALDNSPHFSKQIYSGIMDSKQEINNWQSRSGVSAQAPSQIPNIDEDEDNLLYEYLLGIDDDDDDDDVGSFRIIGGNAATGSGTPLNIKGRSGRFY